MYLTKYEKKRKVVVRHNDLIEAKMDISLMQMRVFLKTLTLIGRDDTDFKIYTLSVSELVKEANLNSQNWYSQLKRELTELARVHLDIPTRTGYLITHLFSSVEYKEGIIELAFDPKLKPYLLQVKGNFTKYELEHAMKMKSVYSIRMYELLKQYVTFGKRKFSVEYLRDILHLQDKYKNFNGFKERVLEKAKKDCEKYSDITFTYKLIYSGRSVSDIVCFIKRKEGANKEIIALPVAVSDFEQTLLEAGISQKRLLEITQLHTNDYLQFVWQKTKNQNPKDLAAFFLKALQEEYYKMQYKALQDAKIKNKAKTIEQDKKRKEDALKHEFHAQYVEARDETEFKPTKADKNAFEKIMKERIATAPVFQIMFDTYLQTGTSTEFRDFLLKKYGKPSQYNFEEYIKSK